MSQLPQSPYAQDDVDTLRHALAALMRERAAVLEQREMLLHEQQTLAAHQTRTYMTARRQTRRRRGSPAPPSPN